LSAADVKLRSVITFNNNTVYLSNTRDAEKTTPTKGEVAMASSFIKLERLQLAPGLSITRHWNNATPLAVWYIQAIPLESSFTANPADQSVEVEVTRVWRKLNRTLIHGPEFDTNNIEHEIWYVIKNVGTREVNFDVYASIIS
jgi:hypothetical protein